MFNGIKMPKQDNQILEAYAFLNCSASQEEIELGLPSLREEAVINEEMEIVLSRIEDVDQDKLNLAEIVSEAQNIGMNYSLEGKFPVHEKFPRTNDDVVYALTELLEEFSVSPSFKDRLVSVALAYEQDGKYVFYEEDGRRVFSK